MQFILRGLITPKARPRVYNGRATMPEKYRQWKEMAIYELWMQKDKFTSNIIVSEVCVVLIGKHHRKSDADNILGSCLDALVQAEYLKDDSMMNITKVSLELRHSQEPPYAVITLL